LNERDRIRQASKRGELLVLSWCLALVDGGVDACTDTQNRFGVCSVPMYVCTVQSRRSESTRLGSARGDETPSPERHQPRVLVEINTHYLLVLGECNGGMPLDPKSFPDI
jgi:hypothetical protein